jgi:uncharacterized RDD family membrane protein YckC
MLRSMDVRTGEAVEIRYELAGLGSRFLALVVDMLAQFAIALALLIAFSFAAPGLSRLPLAGKNVTAWLIAFAILLLFMIFFGWFIIFETWWSGRTPGKRALGLRVVRDGGFPLDAGAAIIRNLVRIAELGLGFYTISAISALVSKENKRLGDFAAGTLVVRDRSDAVPDLDAYLARAARSDIGLSAEDGLLVNRFLARRATLDRSARQRLAARIAERIRPTLTAAYGHLDDETLLEFLAGG